MSAQTKKPGEPPGFPYTTQLMELAPPEGDAASHAKAHLVAGTALATMPSNGL